MTTVGEWMRHPVHVIKPLDTVAHARDVMEQHRINQLPVVVNGHVVGIVTDRDVRDAAPSIVDGFAAADDPTAAVAVETVMTRAVLTVTPTESLRHAAALMRRERIGALPVLQGGKLVGIVTRSDVLAAFSAETERIAPAL